MHSSGWAAPTRDASALTLHLPLFTACIQDNSDPGPARLSEAATGLRPQGVGLSEIPCGFACPGCLGGARLVAVREVPPPAAARRRLEAQPWELARAQALESVLDQRRGGHPAQHARHIARVDVVPAKLRSEESTALCSASRAGMRPAENCSLYTDMLPKQHWADWMPWLIMAKLVQRVGMGRTTMKRTMMPGPMASAASVDGANEPTASPSDVDANDSSVSTPQNFANLAARPVRRKSA